MLRPSHRILLLAEVVVCFAPVLLVLVIGIFLTPFQIYAINDQPLFWKGPARLTGSVACGLAGLATLTFVLHKLIRQHAVIRRPLLVYIGIILGTLPLVSIVVAGSSPAWRLVGALPLLASAHILFLGRRMLFSSFRETVKRLAIAMAIALPAPLLVVLGPAGTAENEIQNQRSLWAEIEPPRYQYTVQLIGWVEPEAHHPKRITVENGLVSSAVYTWKSNSHDVGDTATLEALWTMDRAFEELLSASARGWEVSAQFDKRWGFVERALVDADESQSGWEIQVTDFRVVAPTEALPE